MALTADIQGSIPANGHFIRAVIVVQNGVIFKSLYLRRLSLGFLARPRRGRPTTSSFSERRASRPSAAPRASGPVCALPTGAQRSAAPGAVTDHRWRPPGATHSTVSWPRVRLTFSPSLPSCAVREIRANSLTLKGNKEELAVFLLAFIASLETIVLFWKRRMSSRVSFCILKTVNSGL